MSLSYTQNEKRLFEILSKNLPNKKYIHLENSSILKIIKSKEVKINYDEKCDLWFFRYQISNNESIYCFGLKNDNEIKLILRGNSVSSNSALRFFKKGQIGIEIQFFNDRKKIFNFLKDIFKLMSPRKNSNKYFLMLVLNQDDEIIQNITNLIKLVNFDFESYTNFLLINGPSDNKNNGIASKTKNYPINKLKKINKDISPKQISKDSVKIPDMDISEEVSTKKLNGEINEIFSEIQNAIDEGYKYIILELGHVKSKIATKLANAYGNSLILTYNEISQKRYAKSNNFTVLDYDDALTKFKSNPNDIKKELLIMDDAHRIEEKILNNFLFRFGLVDIVNDLESVMPNINQKLKKLKNKNSQDWLKFFKQVDLKYQDCINSKCDDNLNYEDLILNNKEVKEVIEYLEDNQGCGCSYEDDYFFFGVTFTPLNIGKIVHKYMLNNAKTCIFMSSSILDYEKFSKDLNINVDEVKFIHRDYKFDSKKTKIFTRNSVNMNIKSNFDLTIPIIEKILADHENDKGLIYVSNSDYKRSIIRHIKNKRFMTHGIDDYENKINSFKKRRSNNVLVSELIHEGVEFPKNKCRFQILLKQPIDSNNSFMNYRNDGDEYKTAINFVQIFNRVIQSEYDYCTIYMLDENFMRFIITDIETNKFIPEYMLNSIADADITNQGFVTENIRKKYGVYYLHDYIPDNRLDGQNNYDSKRISISKKIQNYKDYSKNNPYINAENFKKFTKELMSAIVEFSNEILDDNISKMALISVPSSTRERDKLATMKETINYIEKNYNNGKLKSEFGFKKEIINCGNMLYRFSDVDISHLGRRPCYAEHMKSIKCNKNNILKMNDVAFIILDDITTRGTIMNACEDILIENGANKENIYKLAIAKTVGLHE